MQIPLGNQSPDLRTALMNMSLVLRLPRKMHLCRSSLNVPRLPSFFWQCYKKHNVLLSFEKVHNPLHLLRKTSSERPKMVRTWCVLYMLVLKCVRATTACTFSTSDFPKVVRQWCALYILTSKSAWRHNHFFIFHLARWFRTHRFSAPTFQPFGTTNHWKSTMFRDFPTFSRMCIFFLLALSLL